MATRANRERVSFAVQSIDINHEPRRQWSFSVTLSPFRSFALEFSGGEFENFFDLNRVLGIFTIFSTTLQRKIIPPPPRVYYAKSLDRRR